MNCFCHIVLGRHLECYVITLLRLPQGSHVEELAMQMLLFCPTFPSYIINSSLLWLYRRQISKTVVGKHFYQDSRTIISSFCRKISKLKKKEIARVLAGRVLKRKEERRKKRKAKSKKATITKDFWNNKLPPACFNYIKPINNLLTPILATVITRIAF